MWFDIGARAETVPSVGPTRQHGSSSLRRMDADGDDYLVRYGWLPSTVVVPASGDFGVSLGVLVDTGAVQ